MPTPKAGYKLKDGTKVPGTTTICGAYKDSGGLLYWAWTQGRDGFDFRETRDKAGEIGTAVHAMVEAHIKGASGPIEELAQLTQENQAVAHKAYNAYLKWEKQNKIEISEQEVQLVSEEFRYGGTLDAVGTIGGKYVLLDWKTSKGVYKNYLLQLAAYTRLWNENCPGREIEGGAWLVRFSKTDGACEPYYFDDLTAAWNQFLLFRQAYALESQLDADLERARLCMRPL